MTHDDERLLETLAGALRGPSKGPSLERVEIIRARAISGAAPPTTVAPRRRWPVALAAAAAAVAVFLAGVALGYRPPGPLQDIVAKLGIDAPVSEREAAEDAVQKLAIAIAKDDLGAVVRANREAKQKVAKLKSTDPKGHDEIEPDREALEVLALRMWPCLYADPNCASGSPSPSPSPTPAATLPMDVATPPS